MVLSLVFMGSMFLSMHFCHGQFFYYVDLFNTIYAIFLPFGWNFEIVSKRMPT